MINRLIEQSLLKQISNACIRTECGRTSGILKSMAKYCQTICPLPIRKPITFDLRYSTKNHHPFSGEGAFFKVYFPYLPTSPNWSL